MTLVYEFFGCFIISAAVSAAVSYAMRPKQITRKVRGPYKPKTQQSLEVEPELTAGIEPKVDDTGFAVSGPIRIPWKQRRKDIEAQHKTKRKQRDEFREMA